MQDYWCTAVSLICVVGIAGCTGRPTSATSSSTGGSRGTSADASTSNADGSDATVGADIPHWRTAELIETQNTGDADFPQVAVDPGGNAIAVWVQQDGPQENVWANQYVAGAGWGTAELIETGDGYARYPQVAVDPTGNAVCVWSKHDGTRENI